MKATKFSETQIAFLLKQADEGTSVAEVCRKAGVSQATFNNWPKKYAVLLLSEMKQLRQLEDENNRLKKIVADLTLDKAMLKDVASKISCLGIRSRFFASGLPEVDLPFGHHASCNAVRAIEFVRSRWPPPFACREHPAS